MGKIIDIMINMTQITSPLIECYLIIGTTILLFILNNINIKNNKLKLFRRILFIILYSFAILFTPLIFVAILGFLLTSDFFDIISEILFYFYFINCIILFLNPIFKLVNVFWLKSKKFEKIIKLCLVSFYGFLIIINIIFINIIIMEYKNFLR